MSISSKGIDLKKLNFTTITEEEELENDKQRILKKFNFLQNNNNNIKRLISESNDNNSNELINQSQVFHNKKLSETNNKDIRAILNFNYKYNSAQKSTNANSAQGSNKNLFLSEEKSSKKLENHKKTILNKLKISKGIKEKFNSNIKQIIDRNNNIKIIPNQNPIIISKKEEKIDDLDLDSDSNTKKESSRELNFKSKNIISGDFIGKDSDSIPDIQQNESFENNKLSENNEDENDIYLISPYQKDFFNTKKFLKLFNKNPSYIVSNRLINEEINKSHIENQNKNYKFISKIREENQQIKQINIKSFLKLNDKALYCLLSFCYEIYNDLILHTNKFISRKINLVFNALFENSIISFSKIYHQHFEIKNHYFIEKQFKKNKKLYSLINLVIECKIITNQLNKSIEFGYNFQVNKKLYNNFWKIDIKKKKVTNLWISSELESYKKHPKRLSYTSPISAFSKGDYFQIDIVIYSKNGPIAPNSIEWTKPIFSEVSYGMFEKKPVGNSYPYDPLRACEIENMIHLWRSELEIQDINLINEFKTIFGKKFIINSISFDISKFIYYKIHMIAYNIGKIPKNIFSSFDIDIIPYENELFNEIQCIGLLNTANYLNSFQIRVGTNVIFYLTDVK